MATTRYIGFGFGTRPVGSFAGKVIAVTPAITLEDIYDFLTDVMDPKLDTILDCCQNSSEKLDTLIVFANENSASNVEILKLVKRIFTDQRDHKQLIEGLTSEIRNNSDNPKGGRFNGTVR